MVENRKETIVARPKEKDRLDARRSFSFGRAQPSFSIIGNGPSSIVYRLSPMVRSRFFHGPSSTAHGPPSVFPWSIVHRPRSASLLDRPWTTAPFHSLDRKLRWGIIPPVAQAATEKSRRPAADRKERTRDESRDWNPFPEETAEVPSRALRLNRPRRRGPSRPERIFPPLSGTPVPLASLRAPERAGPAPCSGQSGWHRGNSSRP